MDPVINEISKELAAIKNWDPETFNFSPPQINPNKIEPFVDSSFLSRPPKWEECRELAVNERGKRKRLNGAQLKDLREKGEFKVDSNFPGQVHTWKVSKILQKGTNKIKDDFKKGLARTGHQFIMSIPNRIYKGDFSLKNGLKNTLESLLDVPRLFIGKSSSTKKYTANQLEKDLLDFRLENLLTRILEQGGNNKFPLSEEIQLNIFICDEEEIRKKLQPSFEKFMQYWRNDKNKRIQHLTEKHKEKCNSKSEILQGVADEEAFILQTEIFRLISETLEPKEAENLIKLLTSLLIVRNTFEKHQKNLLDDKNKFLLNLEKEHSILCKDSDWKNKKLDEFVESWEKTNSVESLLLSISDEIDGQEKFLLDNNLDIEKSEEYKRKKKKGSVATEPERTYEFSFRIWNSDNWKIEKRNDHYVVEKYIRKSTKSVNGWRIINSSMRIGTYFNNGNFWLLANLWKGKFGLRSLFGLDPFETDYKVDTITGEKHPNLSVTWLGRLKNLWHHISNSRSTFEASPDTSILGKSFTRIFNLIWNYCIKGGIGTPLILIGHPLLTLCNTLFSVLGSVTSPIWAILLPLLQYLFEIIIYDFEAPSGQEYSVLPLIRLVFWKFLIKGLGLSLASISAVAVHGIAGTMIFIWTCVANAIRYAYDSTIYHLLLKHKSKIPLEDGFLVKRISGPGLSSNYYYLISHEVATNLLEYHLEKLEFEQYVIETRNKIATPMRKLSAYFEKYKEVGLQKNEDAEPIKTFQRTRAELDRRLDDIITKHWQNVGRREHFFETDKIKLSREDLAIALQRGSKITSTILSSTLFSQMSHNEVNSFWNNKNVASGDWESLTRTFFKEIFNNHILVPIEDTDLKGFSLIMEKTNMVNLAEELFNGEVSDDISHPRINYPNLENDNLPKPVTEPTTLENMFTNNPLEKMLYITKRKMDEFWSERKKQKELDKSKRTQYGSLEIA